MYGENVEEVEEEKQKMLIKGAKRKKKKETKATPRVIFTLSLLQI